MTSLYYCYECDRTVRPNNISGLACPYCNGGFLEECSGSGAVNVFPRSWRDFDYRRGGDEDEELNPFVMFHGPERGGRYPRGSGSGGINPLLLFQNEMQNMLAGNMDAFMNNRANRLRGNIGDYFFGPGLDQLIQQLSENDPRHRGAPPASRSAVEALRNIRVGEDILGTDAARCAVCKDDFELHSRVKQMPCKHMYHSDCILPWLAQHNSCPVCRYELPTNDQEYEARRRRSHSTWNSTPGGGQGERERAFSGSSTVGGSRQEPTRRFPLLFPWFRSGAAPSQSSTHTQAESSRHVHSLGDSQEENTGAFATSRIAEDDGSFFFESWLAELE